MRLEPSSKRLYAARPAQRQIRTLLIITSFAVLSSSSLVLQGCGLTINSNSSTVASTPVTTPADPGETGGQVVPVPAVFQPLTGCTNPNIGIASGDLGVATPPVYTTVDNTDPVVGAPIYKSNAIFWTSHENAPGQSILLAGAFTDATKNARIAVIPPGTDDWQSLIKASQTVVPTIQQGTTGLSFTIPSGFVSGVYGFQIEDPTAAPVAGLANQPALGWATGVPSTVDATQALRHEVYDCGVEPGGTLRIFGKNFIPSNVVVLQSPSGVAYPLVPSRLDATSAIVSIPTAMTPGTYNVWVGSLPWGASSSPAGKIAVVSTSSRAVFTVTCSQLVGDGVTDNTKNLQSCLDLYAPIGSREIAYIAIGYNTFQHMGSDSQQIITNDGDGGSHFGPIASSTPNTLTLANDPNWNWMGTSNPQAAVVVIAFGTGVGQYSLLKSYPGRTLTLSTPLAVLPDSTSVVGVFQYELNMTIAHNEITNTLEAQSFLGMLWRESSKTTR